MTVYRMCCVPQAGVREVHLNGLILQPDGGSPRRNANTLPNLFGPARATAFSEAVGRPKSKPMLLQWARVEFTKP